MYESASSARSVWADLDALVLEEVNALQAAPEAGPEAPDFASAEDFSARAAAFLRGHPDPESLVEALCAELGLFRLPEEKRPDPPPEAGPAHAAAEARPAPDDPDAPRAAGAGEEDGEEGGEQDGEDGGA
jgi:hypothetical protein